MTALRSSPVSRSLADGDAAAPLSVSSRWPPALSRLSRDPPTRLFFVFLVILLLTVLLPVSADGPLSRWLTTLGGLILLPILTVAILAGTERLHTAAERRFWHYISLALLSSLAFHVLLTAPGTSRWLPFVADAFYVGFYLLWLLAASLQAHLPSRSRFEVVSGLRAAGTLALVCGLFVYFVLLPGNRPPAPDSWRASLYLFPVLDAVLAVQLFTLGRAAAHPRWRRVYFLLAGGFVFWMLLDLLEAVRFLEPLVSSPAADADVIALWYLSLIPLVLAARLRLPLPGEPEGLQEPAAPTPESRGWTTQLTSPLILSAFILPLIHFLFYGLGLLHDAARQPRETLVLVSLLLLGGMALVEHTLLNKQQTVIEAERAAASRDARRQATFLMSLVESSPLAIVMLDPAGRITQCNQAFESLFQYTRLEALGESLDELVAPEELLDGAKQLTQRVLQGEVVRVVTRRKRKDGVAVDVESHGVPTLRGDTLIGLYVLYLDIGERLRLESQLRHSQRMEGLGRLAGGVAHDFNNLLTAILGFAELIDLEVGSQSEVSEPLRRIRVAGERASDLVRQLLAFGRRQVLKPRVLDLNALVTEFEALLRRTLPENIELVLRLERRLGSIKADPGQVEQVLMNLAVNSRDAMPDGGRMSIETRNVDLDQNYVVEHQGASAGPHVMMAVTDSGHGMDEETKRRIFEPFFTTKERGQGSGLGLATVYGIVKQSGGNIWVYSELERGTTFKIYFPRVAGEPQPLMTTTTVAARGSGETLLVVEDEESVRTLTCQVLELAGYSVLTCGTAGEALDRCQTHSGPIDLLLTDVLLPDRRGTDLAKLIAAQRPGLKVLYMSGYSYSSMSDQLQTDASSFIEKPFTRTALLNKVRQALDSAGGSKS